MATVPSIDNQLPQLQQENSNISSTDSESVVPFGHWLEQQSQAEDLPQPIQFKQSTGSEEPESNEPNQKTLFADKTSAKEKPSKALFKEPAEKTSQQNIIAKAKDTKTATIAKQPAVANKTTGTSMNVSVSDSKTDSKQVNPASVTTQHEQVTVMGTNTTASERVINTQQTSNKTSLVNSKAFKPVISVHSTAHPTLKPSNSALSTPQHTESLAKLKTNVKAIFNSLTPLKTSAPTDTSIARPAVPSAEKRKATVVMDKVKPIRLTSQPATSPKVLQDGQTTLQHLKARKSVRLDPESQYQLKAENKEARVSAEASTRNDTVQLAKSKGSKSETIQLVIESKTESKKATAKSKKYGKKTAKLQAAKKGQEPASYDHIQHVAKEMEAIKSNNALQATANQAGQAEFVQSESASTDANSNNLMGKSESNVQVSTPKGTGKAASAHASRSLSWLKALSDRTVQFNKQDPNWKVLEMKLDKGDGRMIVKVMREDEHVSVSVQFSDDTLRANAESQMSQILESLKEQYGKDVSFTFGDQEDADLHAALEQKASRKRRQGNRSTQAEQPVQMESYNAHAPDQRMWIG